MWFKNLLLYRLSAEAALDINTLEVALQAAALKPCGPLEQRSTGFVSPLPEGFSALHLASSGAAFIELGIEERVLPPAVVRKALKERIAAYRQKLGRTPGKRVREQLKDEVLHELLPRAFVRSKEVAGYIDPDSRLMVVDSSSAKMGEALASKLRDGLGSFPVEPVATEESIGGVLTRWLLDNRCDSPFQLGDECVLFDPLDSRCKIRATKHDLGLDEVREHARAGKRIKQLGVVFDNRLAFTLDEQLVIRKLRFLDLVEEELGDVGEDAMAEMDARATLMVLELRRLFTALDALLRLV